MVRVAVAVLISFMAASARAQTPYVAGTIGADVARVSHTESNFVPNTSGNNEVWSASLRVGTAVS